MPYQFKEFYLSICAGKPESLTFEVEGTTFVRHFRPGERCCIIVDMSIDVAEEEGMVCGGRMKVLIEDVI